MKQKKLNTFIILNCDFIRFFFSFQVNKVHQHSKNKVNLSQATTTTKAINRQQKSYDKRLEHEPNKGNKEKEYKAINQKRRRRRSKKKRKQ